MKNLIIIISILLLSSPVIGQEIGFLYGWETPSGFKWKSFGDAEIQKKYDGEIKNGKPDGYGNLYYPSDRGKKISGEWKEGEQLNTTHYNKSGEIIGKWIDGVKQYAILYGKQINKKSGVEWSENRSEKSLRYTGDTKNGKPHGKGTGIAPDGKKYVGEWKNGLPNGQGKIIHPDGKTYSGILKDGQPHGQGTRTTNDGTHVGEWKNGKRWNVKYFNKEGEYVMRWVNGDWQDTDKYGKCRLNDNESPSNTSYLIEKVFEEDLYCKKIRQSSSN